MMKKFSFILIIGLAFFVLPDFAYAINTAPIVEITSNDLIRNEDNIITAVIGDMDGNANVWNVSLVVDSGDEFLKQNMLCSGDGYMLECRYPVTPDENWGLDASIILFACDTAGACSGFKMKIVNIQTYNVPLVEITSGNLTRNKNQEITAKIIDTDGDIDHSEVWVHVKSATSDWKIDNAHMSYLGNDIFSYTVNLDCDTPDNAVVFISAKDEENHWSGWKQKNINIIDQLSEINCSDGIDNDCNTFTDLDDGNCAVPGVCKKHNVSGWAWSENIGWISFSCRNCDADGDGKSDGVPFDCPSAGDTIEDYGVDINPSNGDIYGYAWSEHIGWIDFSPTSPFPSAPNHSVKVNSSGEVSGWAKVVSNDEYIKFSGVAADLSPYGVTINLEKKFNGWAWGDFVVGWLGFSSGNCDTDGDGDSDGGDGCPPDGDTIEPYEVETIIDVIKEEENEKPNKPSAPFGHPTGKEIDYCAFSKDNTPAQGVAVQFYWTYFDPENDEHTASEVWVDNDTSFSGSNPEFYTILSGNSTFFDLNLLQNRNLGGLSQLQWGVTYYWKVRVQDAFDNWSEWSDVDGFTMPVHRFPIPDFSRDIVNPEAREKIIFTDLTNFKGSNPGLRTWRWSFGDGVFSSLQNSTHKYRFSGRIYTTTLKGCDEVGCCSISKKIRVGSSSGSGGWLEIPPVK